MKSCSGPHRSHWGACDWLGTDTAVVALEIAAGAESALNSVVPRLGYFGNEVRWLQVQCKKTNLSYKFRMEFVRTLCTTLPLLTEALLRVEALKPPLRPAIQRDGLTRVGGCF